MNETNKRYTHAETAAKMEISRDTLRILIQKGLIVPYKIVPGATRSYFSQAEIDRFFAARQQEAIEEAKQKNCVVDCVAYPKVNGLHIPVSSRRSSPPQGSKKKALR